MELAREGVLFRQAFTANPTCSPSWAVLLAGQYAHVNGMTGLEIIGYDEYLGGPDEAHTKAVEFLENSPKDTPFFLSVGFMETHRKFPLEHSYDNPDYVLPPAPLPDCPEIQEDIARFKEMARIWDWKTGTILDAVKRKGLEDNTLVIITTDHRIPFPRMKCNLYDSGIGVLLMMRGPDGFSGGKVFDDKSSRYSPNNL